jgi:hypothetical protein
VTFYESPLWDVTVPGFFSESSPRRYDLLIQAVAESGVFTVDSPSSHVDVRSYRNDLLAWDKTGLMPSVGSNTRVMERNGSTFRWVFKAGGREKANNQQLASQIESALRVAFASGATIRLLDDESWRMSMPNGRTDGYEIQGRICDLPVRIPALRTEIGTGAPKLEFCIGDVEATSP